MKPGDMIDPPAERDELAAELLRGSEDRRKRGKVLHAVDAGTVITLPPAREGMAFAIHNHGTETLTLQCNECGEWVMPPPRPVPDGEPW